MYHAGLAKWTYKVNLFNLKNGSFDNSFLERLSFVKESLLQFYVSWEKYHVFRSTPVKEEIKADEGFRSLSFIEIYEISIFCNNFETIIIILRVEDRW